MLTVMTEEKTMLKVAHPSSLPEWSQGRWAEVGRGSWLANSELEQDLKVSL